MLKYASIFAMLTALGLCTANAQQTQAIPATPSVPSLTKMDVHGADFDIVIATFKPGANIPAERTDQWRSRVYLVPKGEAFPSPE